MGQVDHDFDRPRVVPLDWAARPLDVLRAWPDSAPLACLLSGGNPCPRSRWSILAAPVETLRSSAVDRDPLAPLSHLRRARRPTGELPFVGGWIGWISYDLGRVLEPTAQSPGPVQAARWRDWPAVELMRCPGAFVHDRKTSRWFAVGDAETLPTVRPVATARGPEPPPVPVRFVSATGRDAYERAVAAAVDQINHGVVFQANLSHHLRARVPADVRDIATRLLETSGAWYGAHIEARDAANVLMHAIVSASPELFLEFDPRSRRLMTRPIKGTRPATGPDRRADLKQSDKDRAELAMIVDLMRNDLGRVCEFGSVAVDDPRSIEHHGTDAPAFGVPGVYHGVATVTGVVRRGLDVADILRATFPPGSVTGAPKIRAMQMIDELEPLRRGPYCGCVGYVSDCGHFAWNVAIRTAMLAPAGPTHGAPLDVAYPVGAGIVAQSEPDDEWRETIDKAGVLRRALHAAIEDHDRAADHGPTPPPRS